MTESPGPSCHHAADRILHAGRHILGPRDGFPVATRYSCSLATASFVAEGLVLAARAGSLATPSERLRILHRAHLRWLRTQSYSSASPAWEGSAEEGWLLRIEGLHSQRMPGNTCVEGLRSERMGRLEHPIVLHQLGGGWIAEEALAIGLYCALVASSVEEGLLMAVNHSGDSESTGSIAGNLLGAMYGLAAIPSRWIESLELGKEISGMADTLVEEAS